MLNDVFKYLVLHDHVSIPGIGNFSIRKEPAHWEGNTLRPPMPVVVFEPGTALTDKRFYRFIAAEQGITEVEAVRHFQDVAYQLRKDLQANTSIELSGWGTFTKDNAGQPIFHSSLDLSTYLPGLTPVALVKPSQNDRGDSDINRNEAEFAGTTEAEEVVESTARPDRWKVWALILGGAAILAILIHLMQEGAI